jgi:hypothetical protein
VLARKRARISSRGSYDSCDASMVSSVTSAGSAGSCCAGPRVRVRRGRRAKLPEISVSLSASLVEGVWSTNELLVGLLEEDGVVCLAGSAYGVRLGATWGETESQENLQFLRASCSYITGGVVVCGAFVGFGWR